jgi:hypothetical protein
VNAHRDRRLACLAEELGLGIPPFEGPLSAFAPPGPRTEDDPIYLGGDLHAVHPEAKVKSLRPGGVDPSLDGAEILITNFEDDAVKTSAVDGIWCVGLSGPVIDTAPYFSITDIDGRCRTWILLPPPRLMIGMGHYWLPAVPA